MTMRGKIVNLVGLTAKAKSRIAQVGSRWELVYVKDRVQFDSKPGPWLLCESLAPANAFGGELLWVHRTDDTDYAVVCIDEEEE